MASECPGEINSRASRKDDPRALLFVFRRFVARLGSSVRVRSPIASGSAFANELLLRF